MKKFKSILSTLLVLVMVFQTTTFFAYSRLLDNLDMQQIPSFYLENDKVISSNSFELEGILFYPKIC